MRADELNVALAGLRRAERRVTEFASTEPGLPLRPAVVECLMWADTIREELGIPPKGTSARKLTVNNLPWHIVGGRPADTSERVRTVELIHGFRWARNRALHERLLEVEGVGGGVATSLVTPMVTQPPERWVWDKATEAHPDFPDLLGAAGYLARLRGREVQLTLAEVRQLYELAG